MMVDIRGLFEAPLKGSLVDGGRCKELIGLL